MWLAVATILSSITVLGLAVATSKQHVSSFLSLSSRKRALNFPPSEMSALDVASLICLLVWKAVQMQLGLKSSLASRIDNDKCNFSPYGEVDLSARLSGYELFMPLRLLSTDMRKYVQAVQGESNVATDETDGLSLKQHVASIFTDPAHLSLFFSAISEPAFLVLLARRDCPIQPLGAVNVRNSFEIHDPPSARQLIDACFDASQTALQPKAAIHARILPTARTVKRGIEIDISVSVQLQPSEHESMTIFTQIFTLLEFIRWPKDFAFSLPLTISESTETAAAPATSNAPEPQYQAIQTASAIKIHSSDPALWAALCLDYNPIHHLMLAARVAGFQGRIAHGNHVAARAVTTGGFSMATGEDGGTKDRRYNTENRVGGEKSFAMEVAFRRPVVVGTQLDVVQRPGTPKDTRVTIDVVDKESGKVCVEIVLHSR